MKNLVFPFFLLLTSTIFIPCCTTISGFEEGRALGKRNNELIMSGNLIIYPEGYEYDNEDLWGILYQKNYTSPPYCEVSYKYGVTDKLDLGARLNIALNFGAFLKYQLIGDNMSKFALGTGMEFTTLPNMVDAPFNSIQLPVNMSYYISETTCINLSPRYIYEYPAGSFSTPIHHIGANASILTKFGKKSKSGIDIGYYYVLRNYSLFTIGLGLKF